MFGFRIGNYLKRTYAVNTAALGDTYLAAIQFEENDKMIRHFIDLMLRQKKMFFGYISFKKRIE